MIRTSTLYTLLQIIFPSPSTDLTMHDNDHKIVCVESLCGYVSLYENRTNVNLDSFSFAVIFQ